MSKSSRPTGHDRFLFAAAVVANVGALAALIFTKINHQRYGAALIREGLLAAYRRGLVNGAQQLSTDDGRPLLRRVPPPRS